MLLRHRTGAFIRRPPYTRCDCWVAKDVIFRNEYGITPDLPCNRVVDVGANIGCFARKVQEVHPAVNIVCVEPLQEHLECLRANAPTATILHAALTWSGDTVDIYAPEDELQTAFQQGTGMTVESTMHARSVLHCTVPAVTLRQILDRMNWDEADLLKLDCEMCEFEVFAHLDELVKFRVVRGEYHDLSRMQQATPALAECFTVTVSGGPRGHFWLERR